MTSVSPIQGLCPQCNSSALFPEPVSKGEDFICGHCTYCDSVQSLLADSERV